MTVTDLVSYEDALASYDPVMGLEVHVELGTKTKMFCGCSTTLGADANAQTCPTCLGLPGSLPVVNAIGVESAIKIGLALNCSIAPWGRFARPIAHPRPPTRADDGTAAGAVAGADLVHGAGSWAAVQGEWAGGAGAGHDRRVCQPGPAGGSLR